MLPVIVPLIILNTFGIVLPDISVWTSKHVKLVQSRPKKSILVNGMCPIACLVTQTV